MNKLIGIKNVESISSVTELKRDLLLFDKLFIVGLQEWKQVIEKETYSDMKNLISTKGLISLNDFVIYQGLFAMNDQVKSMGGWDKYYDKNKTDELEFRNNNLDFLINEEKVLFDYNLIEDKNKTKDIHKDISPIIESKLHSLQNNDTRDFIELHGLCQDLKTRIVTSTCDSTKYTAINSNSSIYNIDKITNTKSDVYNLILDDFPIISVDNISWEQIFDFKNDPDIYNSIWGLRNWITNVSNSNKSISEIEEEYRYFKYKYEQGIRLHKLKTSNSVFQTTIQSSAELLENIAKLKFGKMANLLFKFRENKISMMDSELNNPGNQFSYLFKIKNKFN